LVIKWCWFWL